MESERLFFRKLTENDFADLCRILQDDEVMYAYEGKFSDKEVTQWLDRQLWRYENENGHGLYAVILKENGELIGQCGLTFQDYKEKRVLEIGYLFQKRYWHKGYAAEAARAWKRYAFEELGEKEVYSIIRDTNTASQNVALRNGMTKTDVFIKHYRGIDMPHFVYMAKNEK